MNVLAYWGARTGIFVVVLVLLWSIGWRDVLAVIAAFIVGWLISYLVLPNMRERAKAQMDGWVTRSHARQHAEDSVEDAEADATLERDANRQQDAVGEPDGADAAKDERHAGRDSTDAHGDGEQQRR